MAAWAGMLWFLYASGRWALFLSTRTVWVLPLGASLLSVCAIGRFVAAVRSESRPILVREAWGLGLIVLPVVAVLAMPPTALGTYAAARRTNVGAGFVPSGTDVGAGRITIVDVANAEYSRPVMEALSRRAGAEVSFVGFVDRDSDMPADEFTLTQFIITCCIDDALVARVHVVNVPPGKLAKGQWVRVQGRIYPVGREVILDAARVRGIPRPKNPYITL
jgi:uncharacterized repeat protein (TIGR03943 family)